MKWETSGKRSKLADFSIERGLIKKRTIIEGKSRGECKRVLSVSLLNST